MDANELSALALVVSGVGLIVSVCGVGFSAAQSRHASNSTSIAAVQHFITECRTLWAELHSAAADPDDLRFRRTVGQILAHFETMMTITTDGMMSGKTGDLVEGTIRDYIDKMSVHGFRPYVEECLDHPEVCKHLRGYCLQNGGKFRNQEAVFEMMQLPRHAL